jgi:hypothetical protein
LNLTQQLLSGGTAFLKISLLLRVMAKLLYFFFTLLLGCLLALSVAGLHSTTVSRLSLQVSSAPLSCSVPDEEKKSGRQTPEKRPVSAGLLLGLRQKVNAVIQKASMSFFADLSRTKASASYRNLRSTHYRVHRAAVTSQK